MTVENLVANFLKHSDFYMEKTVSVHALRVKQKGALSSPINVCWRKSEKKTENTK